MELTRIKLNETTQSNQQPIAENTSAEQEAQATITNNSSWVTNDNDI